MWEKRYGLLTPDRTDTNIRYYDAGQLKHLLNVSLLLGFGYKISRISHMTRDELTNTIQQHVYDNQSLEDQAIENKINGLIVAMIDLDEQKFSAIYETSVRKRGFENTMVLVIYPFLERVGVMWGINEINPAEEHFISNLIRQKIIVAIDELEMPQRDKDSYLLYLPEDEWHELGLLMANYLIRKAGHPSIHLGQNVPFKDMLSIFESSRPNYVVVFVVTSLSREGVQTYLQRLHETFSHTTVYLSGLGSLFDGASFPDNIVHLKHIRDLQALLQ